MGRIEVAGEVLVDQREAREILECSRATFFRRIKAGLLHQIHVTNTRTVYVTLDSVMESKNSGPQFQLKKLEPEATRELKQQHIRLRFPDFTEYPAPPESNPDPGLLPSGEE